MPTFREVAAISAYDVFSLYLYPIVNLVFPTSGFSGTFVLIVPFPDHCLPFYLLSYNENLAIQCVESFSAEKKNHYF